MRAIKTITVTLLIMPALILNAATISLPGNYEMSPDDMIVLDEAGPDRTIVFNLENLLGNQIDFAVRYGNVNAMNMAFGDIPTAGAFGVFVQGELIFGEEGILEAIFAESQVSVGELVGEDGRLRLRLALTGESDPLAFYRPWLYVTDDVVPAATEDLEVTRSLPTALKLNWTAAGDDGTEGTAAIYEIRYSKWPVEDIEEWWGYAEQAPNLPYPSEPGSNETYWAAELDTVSNYHFVLVTYDEVGNRSDFSNIASGLTGEDSGPQPGENYCLEFNGENSFANVPFNEILNPAEQITIEAWYKTTEQFVHLQQCILDKPYYEHDLPAYQYLMAPYNLEADGPDYFYTWLTVNGNGDELHITDVGGRGVWVHAAMTFDGITRKVYIDGELAGSLNQPGSLGGYETGIRFGALTNMPLWYFNGMIDEIRIWEVARTQDEIQENMHYPLSGDEPGLIAYWNFDEGAGQQILDLTGNGSNGYLGINLEMDENDPVWVESDAPIEYLRTDSDDRIVGNIPIGFSLNQNYPNPFNAETKISLDLPVSTNINLAIFDMLGRKVKTLAEGFYQAGIHQFNWDGKSDTGERLSSGVYFYTVKSDSFNESKKMLMLK